MLDKNTVIKVTNRSNGTLGYRIPDMNNLRREFAPKETKEILMDELRKLSYTSGGQYILTNLVQLDNEEAIHELVYGKVQPEYYYSDEDVKELLINGSLEQLLDCLDYAPQGVLDLIQKYAVELKINNLDKRNAITEKTGFNVSKAIMLNEESAVEVEVEEKTERRAAPINTKKNTGEGATGRRVNPPKYKVVDDSK